MAPPLGLTDNSVSDRIFSAQGACQASSHPPDPNNSNEAGHLFQVTGLGRTAVFVVLQPGNLNISPRLIIHFGSIM